MPRNNIHVNQKTLLNYIRRNPGLTTTQLTTLLRGKTETYYTKTAFNSRLIILEKQGKIKRVKGNASTSDTKKAWRHFITIKPNQTNDATNRGTKHES